MPTNLLITYNRLLELIHLNQPQRLASLRGVFRRDFEENFSALLFRQQQVYPTPSEEDKLERLFRHLITVEVDKATKRREYEAERSERLHWVRFHIQELMPAPYLVFLSEDPEGHRVYIYNKAEQYVVILEPLRKVAAYYLLTAYRVESRNVKKIYSKYKRRLSDELLPKLIKPETPITEESGEAESVAEST